MLISAIAVVSKNGVIGKDGKLPWHLPKDFQFFRSVTMGHYVVTGRKNFEHMGLLKGRKTIVLSRNRKLMEQNQMLMFKNGVVLGSVQEAYSLVQHQGADQFFVVGGGQIYKIMAPFIQKWYLTTVDVEIEDGDTFLEPPSEYKWSKISSKDFYKDDRHAYDFNISVFEKK